MKFQKNIAIIATFISVVVLTLAIVISNKLGKTGENFYTNLLIGIFSSGVVAAIISLITYKAEQRVLKRKLLIKLIELDEIEGQQNINQSKIEKKYHDNSGNITDIEGMNFETLCMFYDVLTKKSSIITEISHTLRASLSHNKDLYCIFQRLEIYLEKVIDMRDKTYGKIKGDTGLSQNTINIYLCDKTPSICLNSMIKIMTPKIKE